jgi:DNA-binding CsgD family transcriptional regulator
MNCGTRVAKGAALSLEEAIALAERGRGPRGRSTSGWASLTAREEECAALVADGLTNAQIAARLFVTPATVKTHLSSIFRKLGLRGRRELAQEIMRHGSGR